MRLAVIAFATILPVTAHALDRPGPVTLDQTARACASPYDHIKSIQLLKQDMHALVAFWRETEADGRCWDVPAGKQVFAMERVNHPEFMECIRVQGETKCGWTLPYVALRLK